jgi:hypothetical protein
MSERKFRNAILNYILHRDIKNNESVITFRLQTFKVSKDTTLSQRLLPYKRIMRGQGGNNRKHNQLQRKLNSLRLEQTDLGDLTCLREDIGSYLGQDLCERWDSRFPYATTIALYFATNSSILYHSIVAKQTINKTN